MKYQGYVNLELPAGQADHALLEKSLSHFRKRNLSKTRQAHPLFAQPIRSSLTFRLEHEEAAFFDENNLLIIRFKLNRIIMVGSYGRECVVAYALNKSKSKADQVAFHKFTMESKESSHHLVEQLRDACHSEFTRSSLQSTPASSCNSVDELDNNNLFFGFDAPDPPQLFNHQHKSSYRSQESLLSISSSSSLGDTIHENTTMDCALCESDQGNDWIFLRQCDHVFHHACISNWREQRNCCPLCNTLISHTKFSLHFIGLEQTEGEPARCQITDIIENVKDLTNSTIQAEVQFSGSMIQVKPLTFEDQLFEEKLEEVKFPSSNLVRLDRIEDVLAFTFSSRGKCSVFIFDSESADISSMIFDVLEAKIKRQKLWSQTEQM